MWISSWKNFVRKQVYSINYLQREILLTQLGIKFNGAISDYCNIVNFLRHNITLEKKAVFACSRWNAFFHCFNATTNVSKIVLHARFDLAKKRKHNKTDCRRNAGSVIFVIKNFFIKLKIIKNSVSISPKQKKMQGNIL